MPRPATDLVRMAAAVRLLDNDRSMRCVIGGEPVETGPPAGESAPAAGGAGTGPDESDGPAVRSLAHEIYQRLYTRAGPRQEWKLDPPARRQHLACLSQANCGR